MSSPAFGINDRGRIVGFTGGDAQGTEFHGFVVDRGGRGTFRPIDFPGAPGTIAADINDRDQVVGFYENPNAPSGTARAMSRPAARNV
jgi:hypothetical protein